MFINLFFLQLIFIVNILNAEDLFMSEYEYGKMLYFEPNGVSCASCHGDDGQSQINFEYVVYSKPSAQKKIVPVKTITRLSFLEFISALDQKNRFMPNYRLSKLELTSIYYYLQKKNGIIPSADSSLLKFYQSGLENNSNQK